MSRCISDDSSRESCRDGFRMYSVSFFPILIFGMVFSWFNRQRYQTVSSGSLRAKAKTRSSNRHRCNRSRQTTRRKYAKRRPSFSRLPCTDHHFPACHSQWPSNRPMFHARWPAGRPHSALFLKAFARIQRRKNQLCCFHNVSLKSCAEIT